MLHAILLVLAIIVAVIMLLGAIMKKDYTISSSIVINRPRDVVFDFVKHLKNQRYFSKWVMADPDVQMTYTGEDATVGFIAAWRSDMKNVGIGEQEIKNIAEGRRYDVEIRFKKPFEGTSQAHTTTEAVDAQSTKVTTTFETHSPFPMNIMVPFIRKMLQKDMDENAANLKRVLEQQ